jgi:alkylhydroperoxidase family enzyme
MSHHLASSKRAGVAAEDVQALKNGDFSRFTEAEQGGAALRRQNHTWADEPGCRGGRRPQEVLRREQIVDIVALVALANFTDRVTDGLGLEVEPEVAAAMKA